MEWHLTHLPADVAHALRRYAAARRVHAALRVVAGAATIGLAAALVAMGLDLVLFLPPAPRLVLSRGVAVAAGLALLLGTARAARRRLDPRRAAYALEAAAGGDVDERLVTATQVLAAPPSGDVQAALSARLAALAAGQAASLRPGRLAADAGLARWSCACLAVMCAGALCGAVLGGRGWLLVRRLLDPRGNLPKPGFMTLSVRPDPVVVGAGDEVVLQVRTTGDIPRLLRRPMRWAGADADRCVLIRLPDEGGASAATSEPMSRIQRDLFVLALGDLREGFRFQVRCGDAESAVRRAEVVQQPRVTGLQAVVVPPAYTGLPEETVTRYDRPLAAFSGSRVELRFGVDQTGAVCRVKGPDSRITPLAPAAGDFAFAFTVDDAATYEITAMNARGFECVEKPRLSVVVREDQAPVLDLRTPGSEPVCLPGETVDFLAEATDDLALAAAFAEVRVNPDTDPDAPPREETVAMAAGSPAARVRYALDLGALGVVPGDTLTVVLRARDSGGNDGRAAPVTVRIAAFTAGENERRRLAALELAALAAASLTNDSPRTGWRVHASAAGPVARAAAAIGVADTAVTTGAGLLAFLEREHHFTDRPRDKHDLRLLHGLLLAHLAPVTDAPEAAVGLSDWADACAALRRYRVARLAGLRLLGLQAEAVALTGGAAGRGADAGGGAAALAGAVAAQVQADPALQAEATALRSAREASRAINADLRESESALENQLAMGGAFARAEALMKRIEALKTASTTAADAVLATERSFLKHVADAGAAAAAALQSRHAPAAPAEACAGLGREVATAVWRLRDRQPGKPDNDHVAERVRETAGQYAAALAAGGATAASQRRLALLADEIHAAGAVVVGLSRQVPGCNPAAVAAQQEAVSLALREVQRATGRRDEAATRLASALAALQATVSGWLPALRPPADTARERLEIACQAVARAAAAGRRPEAAQWLSAAWRLLDADPFASTASRVAWIHVAGDGAPSGAACNRPLSSDERTVERANAARLAADAAAAGGEPGGRTADEAAYLRRVAADEVGPDAGAVLRAVPWSDAGGGDAAVLLLTATNLLGTLEARMTGSPGAVSLREVAAVLADARLLSFRVLAANALCAQRAGGEQAAAAAVRMNRLVRAAWARCEATVPGVLADGSAVLSGGDAAVSGVEAAILAQELVVTLRGLRVGLARAAASATAAAEEDDDASPHRRLWRAAARVRRLQRDADAAALASDVAAWAREDAAAGRAVLVRLLPVVAACAADLAQAEAWLAEPADRGPEYAQALTRAAEAAVRVEQQLARVAPGAVDAVTFDPGLAQRIAGAAAEDWRQAVRLRVGLRLADCRSRVDRLQRQLQAAARPPEDPDAAAGGPAGLWEAGRRIDANHARERLLRDLEAWETQALLRVLEAAEAADAAARGAALDEAAARFDAVLRVTVSCLGDRDGGRTRQAGSDTEAVRDPVVRWLLQQVDEARRELRREQADGHYREVTERYLGTVEGFLRY